MFSSKHSINFDNTYLLSRWFHCVGIFYIKLRFCEALTVINSATRILSIETLYKFWTFIKCWFTLYLHMYVSCQYNFNCFVYPSSLSCVSHSIDIYNVAIKNIRNMHHVSTNQIEDIYVLTIMKLSNVLPSRRLGRRKIVTLKTSSTRLQDVFNMFTGFLVLLTPKMFSPRLLARNLIWSSSYQY